MMEPKTETDSKHRTNTGADTVDRSKNDERMKEEGEARENINNNIISIVL